jgi:hypothetical protein
MDTVKQFGTRLFGAATDTANTFAATTGSSYILPIIAGTVVVALIAIIVFVAVQLNAQRPTVTLRGPLDLYEPKPTPVVVDRATTRAQMSGTYTLSFYLRIDAVPDMRVGGTPLITWPGVWTLQYNAAQEQAQFVFAQTTTPTSNSLTVAGFPLQRWTQLTMTVVGRTVDVYLNGTLINSALLDNLPPSGSASITVAPGVAIGQLAYAQLWSRRLTVAEVADNYTETSDSQGRPYLGPDFLKALSNISTPNLFCPSGNCATTSPTASQSQTWEFPYA